MSEQSNHGIRKARLILGEMEELVFASELEDEIAKKGSVSIVTEPDVVYVDQSVRLSARFSKADFHRATARESLECIWNFGHHDLTEIGWNVAHYFPSKGQYTIQMSFRGLRGKPLEDASGNPLPPIKKTIEVGTDPDSSLVGDRTAAELVYLGIALIAAVIALVAGAKEQFLKLDLLPGLIAVFLLGFGADTIKNLLTPRQTSTE